MASVSSRSALLSAGRERLGGKAWRALVYLRHVEHMRVLDRRHLVAVKLIGGQNPDALLALHHDAASGQPAVETVDLGGVWAGVEDAALVGLGVDTSPERHRRMISL